MTASTVTTSTGERITLKRLVARLADAELIPVFLSDTGGIIAYGAGYRFATPCQRRALAARDRGCTAPGCTMPPEWCQAHHVIPHKQKPGTTIDELALVCEYHHLVALEQGWHVAMIDGVPHWTAPPWLDPTRTPRHNNAHHPPISFTAEQQGGT